MPRAYRRRRIFFIAVCIMPSDRDLAISVADVFSISLFVHSKTPGGNSYLMTYCSFHRIVIGVGGLEDISCCTSGFTFSYGNPAKYPIFYNKYRKFHTRLECTDGIVRLIQVSATSRHHSGALASAIYEKSKSGAVARKVTRG